MKKALFILITLVVLCNSISLAASFSDVASNHWAYKNIINLVDEGVINGYPDGTYRPDGQVTRGEFFKLISVAAMGEEYFEPYKEMFKDYWQLPYVTWIYGQNLMMSATSAGDLDVPITRLEMGVVLSKIIDYLEIKKGYFEESWVGNEKIEFTDISDLDYAKQLYINHISEMGLIRGYEDMTYRPNTYMSRAEVATVIYRFLSINEGRGL